MAAAGGDAPAGYVLGLDLGTTSVKAVLLEAGPHPEPPMPAASASQATGADVVPSGGAGPEGREQDVCRILGALNKCLGALPAWQLRRVRCIGVAGQMHGVMFWNCSHACTWAERGPHSVFEPQHVSHLVTWQDGRCTSGFLASLPRPESHLSVATGFGCATIYWLSRHSPEFLVPFSAAGTIQDYVVAMLCGLQRPLMSEHNAASWGYFNTERRSWNARVLEESGFPTHLLPDVAEAGAIAGTTTHEWFGVPQGTKVGVALGDLQCSVFSCMSRSTDAVLNVSTSVQLAASMPPGFKPAELPEPSAPVAYFPYFGRTYLGVAASLNGGNVLATFVTMLAQWMADLGADVAESLIYSQMIQAALVQTDTQLTISPTLLGERHLPDALASVGGISPSALSLGHVSRALCRGVVRNVHAMLPSQRLKEWGVQRLVGSGSALARNEVLRQEVERAFPLPISYGQDVDAAAGAALAMLRESAGGSQLARPAAPLLPVVCDGIPDLRIRLSPKGAPDGLAVVVGERETPSSASTASIKGPPGQPGRSLGAPLFSNSLAGEERLDTAVTVSSVILSFTFRFGKVPEGAAAGCGTLRG